MKRLLKKPFTHLKKRYLLTLDTDGWKLILKCYEGGSESNRVVRLQDKLLKDKVISIISSETDSFLAANVIRDPEQISNKVRNMYVIPYPSIPDWENIVEQLKKIELVEFEGNIEALLQYLEFQRIPVVYFERNGKQMLLNAQNEENIEKLIKDLNLEINDLNQEIKDLNALIHKIYDQEYMLKRKAREEPYF